jgi:hypothetical protein
LQLIFRIHNNDPTPQGVENGNIIEYFIFLSIDSSEARKQYDEYCLSIMQTITYAHDRTHFQGTGWIVTFDLREWN